MQFRQIHNSRIIMLILLFLLPNPGTMAKAQQGRSDSHSTQMGSQDALISGNIAPNLIVSENKFFANGQPFELQGLGIQLFSPQNVVADPFRETYHPFEDPNGRTALLGAAGNWNANTIRIPIIQKWLDPSVMTAAQLNAYLTDINDAVTQSTKSGFQVILAMWNQLPVGSITPFNHGKLAYPAAGDCMPTNATWQAWQRLLPFVKSNSAVLLDIFDEPGAWSGPGWDIWKNGGTFDCGPYRDTALGMQTLVTLVRTAGVQNILIVEPLGYSTADTNPDHLVEDPSGQTVYAIHPYAFGFGGNVNLYNLATGAAFNFITNTAILDAAFGNAAKSIPLIADEWDMVQFTGPSISCADVPQMGYFLSAYIQNNLAGSAATGFVPPYRLTSDWNYTPRGYADPSLCKHAFGNDATINNVGDIGALVYAWYHGAKL